MYAAAQDKTVSGKVTDDTGKTLEGVSIRVKNGTQSTISNENGEFVIKVPSSASILTFSHVGFGIYETSAATDTLNIKLNPLNNKLDEVVVVGYDTKPRANVLGSVATINPKEIEDMPFVNLSTALINKVPGVSISQSSGRPGATTNLTIRNPVTFGASGSVEPLYVIDGIAYTNPEGKEFFDNLDATMVDNISILKDAAASVYGARGANGVVLVTTKKGKPGKPRVNYTGSYGLSEAAKVPETMNAYDHLLALNGKYLGNDQWKHMVYSQEELDYARTHNFDWFSPTWQTANMQRHAVNVTGGSDKISFFGGANYLKETGNLRDLYATRYGFRVGTSAKITQGLTVDLSFANDYAIENRPTPKGITSFGGQSTDQSDQMNGTMAALLLIPKWVPMYIAGQPVYTTAPRWHPLELQNTNSYARTNQRGQSVTANLNYQVPFLEGLTFRLSYGLNSRNSLGKEYYVSYNLHDFEREGNSVYDNNLVPKQRIIFTENPTPTNAVVSIKNDNSLRHASDFAKSYQFNQALSYKKQFGKHDIDVLLLAEQSESETEGFFSSVEGQLIPGVDEFWGYTTDRSFWNHSSSKSEIGRASYLGRINYGFMNKYLLEASFRADASPNFPPGSRWGYFPSVALGWKLSEENFFRNVNFVTDLKLRVQVGATGNDAVRNYQYSERYTQTTGALFGNVVTPGLNPNAIPNPDITWEKALYKNFGLDGSFFNRRFNFSIDYYTRHNTDMLETPTSSVPSTLGIAIADRNYSEMKTWGLEGSLGYEGKINEDFRFSVQANIGWTDNKVIKKYFGANDTAWKNPIGVRTDRGIEGYIATTIFRNQEDVDNFYKANPGWLIDGDSLRVGYLNYEDLNGDGEITEADKTRIAPRSGSIFGMGFNLGFSWKGLKLSVNASMSVGGDRVYDNTARRPPTENQGALAFWRDAWSPSNPNGSYPVVSSTLASEVSTFWVVNGTTLRVNNAQLSYSLPPVVRTKLRLPEVRLFVVGTNLGTIITSQRYKDAGQNTAIDYPILRTVSVGGVINL
jgi:TonB-linked SusC/RagA family outer membrane protein